MHLNKFLCNNNLKFHYKAKQNKIWREWYVCVKVAFQCCVSSTYGYVWSTQNTWSVSLTRIQHAYVNVRKRNASLRNWHPLPFLVSSWLISTILITPFHLTISPLSIPLILLLVLNSLFQKAYLFPNLSILWKKTSHPYHFLYSSRFLHGMTWHFVLSLYWFAV